MSAATEPRRARISPLPAGGPDSAPLTPGGPDPVLATRPLTPGVRAGLLAIAAVIVALGLSLFLAPGNTDELFAWTIRQPLTAAFLGASYLAATVLALSCAAERDWARARAFAPPYLVAGVALLAVTLVHLEQFHMDALTGWAWLALYSVFPPAVVVLLARQLRLPGSDGARSFPPPASLTRLLAAQGVALSALGSALVAVPTAAGALWPWPLEPLAARAVGVFVLAQGVLILTAWRERDRRRARPALRQCLVFGALQLVALARFAEAVDWGEPAAWAYVVLVLGVLALGLCATRAEIGSGREPSAAQNAEVSASG